MRMLLRSVRFQRQSNQGSGKVRQGTSPFNWLVHSQGCGRLDCKGKTDETSGRTFRALYEALIEREAEMAALAFTLRTIKRSGATGDGSD